MARRSVSALVVSLGLMTSATAALSQALPPALGREALRVEAPPPPFSDGIFPCSNCHADMKPDRTRRELVAMHDDIQLKHDEEHRWCLDCHDAENRDFLHLANGERVPFEESYRVCGQCHGEKFRDWRAGVHGRRVGSWNGEKSYLLCPHCHNPHQPRFKALQPKPAPKPPRGRNRPGSTHQEQPTKD
jgi:Zn finger protein HypA/HybF involved in hydrogenase expression